MNGSGFFRAGAALGGAALLFGATSAEAYTVRCVPSLTLDPSCQAAYPSGTPNAIQAAIDAAVSGDIILVGPGTYLGSRSASPIEIPNGTSISLYGAQAGVDPRLGKRNLRGNAESIVDAIGDGGDGSAIVVRAQNVRIDGFTVQGGVNDNGSGIELKGGGSGGGPASGAVVVNNILQGNSTGISVNSEGYPGPVQNVRIERNLIINNNVGPPNNGDGLFTAGMQNALIADNAFQDNETADLVINGPNPPPDDTRDLVISANTSTGSAAFLVVTGTTSATVTLNDAEHLGNAGSLQEAGDAAIAIGPGNSNLSITDNRLAHGRGNVQNGIAFTALFGTGTSTAATVSGNVVEDMPLAQIAADPNTLTNSRIETNQVKGGKRGISLGSGDTGNFLSENTVRGAGQLGCADASLGNGTAGTANTWFRNAAPGEKSSPHGLCAANGGK